MGFLKSIAQFTIGLVTEQPSLVFSSLNEAVGDAIDMSKSQATIQDMENELHELTDAKNNLPTVPMSFEELDEFLREMESGAYDDQVASPQTREKLLNLTANLDMAKLDKTALDFDLLHDTVDDMLAPSYKENVDGAAEYGSSLKSFTATGKASTNAQMGVCQATFDYTRAVYQTLIDKRQSAHLKKQRDEAEQMAMGRIDNYILATVPSALSIQFRLLDLMASLSTEYYYREGADFKDVSNDSIMRDAFSLEHIQAFTEKLMHGVVQLRSAATIARQAWNLDQTPFEINVAEGEGHAQVIEELKQFGQTVISARLIQQHDFLKRMSGVCMEFSSVEIVGVRGNDGEEVEVSVDTHGYPANQAMSDAKGFRSFKTNPVSVVSSYAIDNTQPNAAPGWTIKGGLANRKDYFCRTPFQDMVIRVHQRSKRLDYSQISALRIYMSGNANTAVQQPLQFSPFRPTIHPPVPSTLQSTMQRSMSLVKRTSCSISPNRLSSVQSFSGIKAVDPSPCSSLQFWAEYQKYGMIETEWPPKIENKVATIVAYTIDIYKVWEWMYKVPYVKLMQVNVFAVNVTISKLGTGLCYPNSKDPPGGPGRGFATIGQTWNIFAVNLISLSQEEGETRAKQVKQSKCYAEEICSHTVLP
jgi:hypothetical protein